MGRRRPLRTRFEEKYQVDPRGCWIWTATRHPDGYGQIWDGEGLAGPAGMARAARVAYVLFVGPIPPGLQVDHLCRVRACVNPAHLEAVTARENTLRGDTVGARNLQKTHCPRGHEYVVRRRSNGNPRRRCLVCHAESEKRRRRTLIR